MSETVHLSFGSNLGDRDANIRRAIENIGRTEGIRLVKMSSIYETQPLGPEQPPYLNAAAEIECSLSPAELLETVKRIEKEMGRSPTVRWGPRIIDIDIIFFADRVLNTRDLTIPHPEAAQRTFVLGPLSEIAPRKMHPALGRTVAELFCALEATNGCTNASAKRKTTAVRALLRSFSAPTRYRGASEDEIRTGICNSPPQTRRTAGTTLEPAQKHPDSNLLSATRCKNVRAPVNNHAHDNH